ncbi:MAG: EAL domain-containing protein [Acidobacteria bacterium]|nr:EAL domain-containing protein [Acidobacteriota bacterium]
MTEKILILEDESITALHLRSLLEGWGYAVTAVLDTADGITDVIDKDLPDLVLMDIRLKGETDGIEAARLIHDRFGIPVVFLSAHNDDATRRRVEQSSAYRLVVKPFESQELYVAVKAALHRKCIEQALSQDAAGAPPELPRLGDAVMATDAQGRILYMNERAEKLTGWEDLDAFEHEATDVIRLNLADDGSLVEHPVSSILNDPHASDRQLDSILTSKTGAHHPIRYQVSSIRDSSGESLGAVVTIRRRRELRLDAAGASGDGLFDPATGLVTRDILVDYLDTAIARARSRQTMVGIFLARFDDFARLSTELGQEATNELLASAAFRLCDSVRTSDSVARIREDMFAVIQPDLEHAEGAVILGDKLVRLFREPFDLGAREITATASIGSAIYPVDSKDPNELLGNAEAAADRTGGRDQLRFYSSKIDSMIAEERDLGVDLDRAIQDSQFEILFQPLFDLSSERVVGVEARVQWNHPEQGAIPAESFLPVAERHGVSRSITEWTLSEVLNQGVTLQTISPNIRICLPLTGSEIRRRGLVSLLLGILTDTGIEARHLSLELNEDVLVTQPPLTTHLNLQRLSQLGVGLTLAKYGFSHASMMSFRRTPVQRVKIDRSLIEAVVHEREAQAIVRAIIDLARSGGLEIAADGIENESQWRWLRYHGCEFGQGDLLAEFMTGRQVFDLLVDRTR